MQSGVQYGLGMAAGSLTETIMGKVHADTPTPQLMLEIALHSALIGVITSVSDRTWIAAMDPQEEAGSGMFLLGILASSPQLRAKTEVVNGRARVFFRSMGAAMTDVESKPDGDVGALAASGRL